MRIAQIANPSPAQAAGLRAGDEILRVNGRQVRDSLDFLFYAAEDEVCIELTARGGSPRRVAIRRPHGADLGIRLVPDSTRRCANQCVFCFVDQNPPGLRASLLLKDEDYRLSLLYGNYVTLSNLAERDMQRILEQHLSPLFVSVHATDPEQRRRLLRPAGSAAILPALERLIGGGIRLHTQIVLVPGYNDGPVLEGTCNDLERLCPGVASVAIVPVGLTSHRTGLTPLRGVTPREAGELLEGIEERQARRLRAGRPRVFFAADEFYLLAGRPLPADEAYEDYPQIENGVGLVSRGLQALAEETRLMAFARGAAEPGKTRAVVVTGELFAALLHDPLAAALGRTGEREHFDLSVLTVQNQLFGPAVSVAGLLGGREIIAALQATRPRPALAVLPPAAFGARQRTLDEFTAGDIAAATGQAVQVGFGAGSRLSHPGEAL